MFLTDLSLTDLFQGEYCHCDYCKCKHGYGQDSKGHKGCKGH